MTRISRLTHRTGWRSRPGRTKRNVRGRLGRIDIIVTPKAHFRPGEPSGPRVGKSGVSREGRCHTRVERTTGLANGWISAKNKGLRRAGQ